MNRLAHRQLAVYPIALIGLFGSLIYAMLVWVMPVFSELHRGTPLPWLSHMVFSLSEALQHPPLAAAFGILGVTSVTFIYWSLLRWLEGLDLLPNTITRCKERLRRRLCMLFGSALGILALAAYLPFLEIL